MCPTMAVTFACVMNCIFHVFGYHILRLSSRSYGVTLLVIVTQF